jgi:ComF family protein
MGKLSHKANRKLHFATSAFSKISSGFMELLFPLTCVSCNEMGTLFCEKCLKQIKTNSLQVCFLCQRAITKNGELCPLCKRQADPPINRIIVCGKYQDKLLSRAIHLFKYKFVQDLGVPLGKLQAKTLHHFDVPTPDFIIPILLHKRRLRWRGYNQSTLLAKQLSTELTPGIDIPILENIVLRSRYTTPQMQIKQHALRQKNISGAFCLSSENKISLKGKKLLLVDDVCTTGSTLFECAGQLRALRPKSITAIVLARQG